MGEKKVCSLAAEATETEAETLAADDEGLLGAVDVAAAASSLPDAGRGGISRGLICLLAWKKREEKRRKLGLIPQIPSYMHSSPRPQRSARQFGPHAIIWEGKCVALLFPWPANLRSKITQQV